MGGTEALVEPADAAAPSQTVKAELRLRELVVGGELPPGQRIAELALVERIGVSRTPIRAALHRLAEEGLLDALPGGGFVVRQFSEADIHDAIELRGTLEGLAARLAAERGASPLLLAQARECVAAIDAVLAPAALDEAALADYAAHNARLHDLLAAMSGSALVQRQLERATALPFASPNAFVLATADGARSRESLLVAQAQHRAAVEAIAAREGARAEALMREHARIAQDNLRDALKSPRLGPQIPGAGLIRRRGLR
jgi:GntR family transcriptional regulator of vanillate catabolism